MKYRISGSKRETGEAVEIVVLAADRRDVETFAVGMNIALSAIKQDVLEWPGKKTSQMTVCTVGDSWIVDPKTFCEEFFVVVKGEEYRQEVAAKLSLDERVLFIPQPEKPYDENAVAVTRTDGALIGYLMHDVGEAFMKELRACKIEGRVGGLYFVQERRGVAVVVRRYPLLPPEDLPPSCAIHDSYRGPVVRGAGFWGVVIIVLVLILFLIVLWIVMSAYMNLGG